MNNLISKWRIPETKKMTARIIITKRSAGLILLKDEDEELDCFSQLKLLQGVEFEEGDDRGDEFIEKPYLCLTSYRALPINSSRGKCSKTTVLTYNF